MSRLHRVLTVTALLTAALAAGCLPTHELRPLLESREVGLDFVFQSAEERDGHPNRYFYEVAEESFGPFPRIILEPRVRVEIDDNLDLDASQADTGARALTRVRIVIDAGRWREFVNYRVELQDSRELFSGSDAGTDALDLRLGYVFLSTRRAIWGVKLGRQEMDFGSGVLLGADWHDNLDRSFDGARLTLADRWGRQEPRQWSWRVDVFAGQPVRREAGPNMRRDEPSMAGVFYSDRRPFPVRVDGLFILTRNGGAEELIATLAGTISGERFGRARAWSLEAEAAVQFGRRGPYEHFGLMATAEASYVFPTPWQVRLRASFTAASGDDDPTGGTSRTFQPPFPGDLRERLGLLGLVGLRNVVAGGVGISFEPVENFRLGADVRWLGVAERADGWLDAEGLERMAASKLFGTTLGREIDISGRYTFTTVSGKDIRIEGGYAVFEPGGDLPAGTGRVQGLYLETTFRF